MLGVLLAAAAPDPPGLMFGNVLDPGKSFWEGVSQGGAFEDQNYLQVLL